MKHKAHSLFHMIPIILAGLLGVRFFYLITVHKILYYINMRLLWFLIIGWTILIITVIVTLFKDRQTIHTHTRLPTFIYVYCLIAILVFLPVRALNPDHALVVKHTTNLEMTEEVLPANTQGYTFSDWYNYFDSGSPQPELEGKIFNASGFLSSYDAEQKTIDIGRLVVTCCISDAYETIMRIELGTISSENLVSNQWYVVSGHWKQNQDGEWVVYADSIDITNVPEDPYVSF